MKKLALCLVCALCFAGGAQAGVESELVRSINTSGAPLDSTMSADGKYLFVLTEEGKVDVFTENGEKEGSIDVGKGADLITASPQGDFLYLSDKDAKETKIVTVDFIYQIPIGKSYYKGAADAPVNIAVFSDFQ